VDLTKENKTHIDSLSYVALLSRWRFAPVGDPWFQGETADYWRDRMAALRDRDPGMHVETSKRIGWDPR
jgi:hypothetical protein